MTDRFGTALTPIASHVWQTKYRRSRGGHPEAGLAETCQRVAAAVARAEGPQAPEWESRYTELLAGRRFLPGGRILAGAGTGEGATLANCFVMGPVDPSVPALFRHLEEAARTMRAGGGIGYDFSNITPYWEQPASPGPLGVMQLWEAMCRVVCASGSRRGAMMASLSCEHPDIEAFIAAKSEAGLLSHFNCSVLVTDAFMEAVAGNAEWPLIFPDARHPTPELGVRRWAGFEAPVPCRTARVVNARELWSRILRSAHDHGDPGVLFIDRMNRENNLGYCETIQTTNPCGEVPLPAHGACVLGSMNLTRFVRRPFSRRAAVDLDALCALVPDAVRFLDDVIDAANYPLPIQSRTALASRRIGLGVTGLGDMLAMLGLDYGTVPARRQAARILAAMRDRAYEASARLAAEKGAFPAFDTDAYLEAPFVVRLPDAIRSLIRRHGIRNSHLIAIAPAGSISLLANNVSSGIEPIFRLHQHRELADPDTGALKPFDIEDEAYRQWRQLDAPEGEAHAHALVTAESVAPLDHLRMQAALQPYVDNAISKTINVTADIPAADLASIYDSAYELGLKGVTVFRPNPVTGTVIRDLCCAGVDKQA